jgi:hypothetical protein
MPDERTFRSARLKRDFKSEKSIERGLLKFI